MWHTVFHYGLIAVACWIAICVIVCIFSKKDASTAAGTSMLPVLLMFFLIAMIVQSNSRTQKNEKPWLTWLTTIVVAGLLAAVIYWHSAIWLWTVSIFAA